MEPQNKRDEAQQPKVDQNQNEMQQENDKRHDEQDEGMQIEKPEQAEADNQQGQNQQYQEGEENDNQNVENQQDNQSNQREQVEEGLKEEKGKQHIIRNQQQNAKKQQKKDQGIQEENLQQAPAQPEKIAEQSISPEKPKGPKKKISQTEEKPHHPPQQTNLQPMAEKRLPESVAQVQAPSSPVYNPLAHEKLTQNISFQSQRYINTLETNLKNKESQLQSVTQSRNSLQAKVLTLQSEYKQVKAAQLSKIQEMLQFTKKQKGYLKQIESLKKNVQSLSDELKSYRQIGDIRVMQRRIQQLQVFVQRQKDQILILKTEQEGIPNQRMQQKTDRLSAKEYINKMEELQNERDELQAKLKQLAFELEKKDSENKDYTGILNQVDKQLKQKMERISELQENIASERSLHITVTQNLQQKIRNLETQLAGVSQQSYSMSQSIERQQRESEQRKQQQQQQIENNSKSQLLKIQQEKQIVFREFLKIELDNKALQQTLKQLKNRYQQTYKDLRNAKKQMVSKKDYDQILIRYKKCRVCLENSIKENKILRNNRGTENNGEVEQPQMEERNMTTGLLNEEQNNIKKYMQVFNSHVQQSVVYLKNTNDIMQNMYFEKYTQDIKTKDKKLKEVQDKNSRLEKLNTIFQRELLYKNTIVDRLAEELKELKKQYYQVEQEKLNIQGDLTQNISAKSALKRLQVKSANLLLRNRKIITEKQNWKALYEQLKQKYELFIARDPYFNGQQQPQNTVSQVQQKQKQQCEQGEIEDENAGNKPIAQAKPITINTQTQTQGLNQLYYKQIKQTLSAVKRFPELIKKTTANYEKVGEELEEYKKKYDQMAEKYNIRHRALNSEKQANDSWREQAKRQIINQYQDIRDLVQSDRLLVCLKKAKSLIEYLQQGDQGEQAEEGQAK